MSYLPKYQSVETTELKADIFRLSDVYATSSSTGRGIFTAPTVLNTSVGVNAPSYGTWTGEYGTRFYLPQNGPSYLVEMDFGVNFLTHNSQQPSFKFYIEGSYVSGYNRYSNTPETRGALAPYSRGTGGVYSTNNAIKLFPSSIIGFNHFFFVNYNMQYSTVDFNIDSNGLNQNADRGFPSLRVIEIPN